MTDIENLLQRAQHYAELAKTTHSKGKITYLNVTLELLLTTIKLITFEIEITCQHLGSKP